MGLIKKLFSLSFKTSFLVVLLAVVVNFLPDHYFGDLKFEPKHKTFLEAQLPANLKIIEITKDEIINLSTKATIFEPESIKFYKNHIYTGTVDGKIIKIDEKTGSVSLVTNLVKESVNCNTKVAKEECGRALDIDIVGNTLYAVDTYRGFIEYDLVKNTKISYDLRQKIPGYEKNDKTFNSIRRDPKNPDIIYLSLSSTKYNFDKIYYIFLEAETSGTLIAFNKKTNKAVTVAKDFMFANGIEVTNDKLLLNDLMNQRMVKLDLNEVNKFVQSNGKGTLPKVQIFKDGLPGYADNLTKHNKNILVALIHYAPVRNIILDQIIMPSLHLRKFTYRFLYIVSESIRFIQNYYKCECLDQLYNSFKSGKAIMFFPYKSAVAILDQTTGNYKQLIKLPVKYITHAVYNEQNQNIYLGSIVHHQISKISVKLD